MSPFQQPVKCSSTHDGGRDRFWIEVDSERFVSATMSRATNFPHWQLCSEEVLARSAGVIIWRGAIQVIPHNLPTTIKSRIIRVRSPTWPW